MEAPFGASVIDIRERAAVRPCVGAAAAAAMEAPLGRGGLRGTLAAPARRLLLAGLLMGVWAAPTEASSLNEQGFVCQKSSVPALGDEELRNLTVWNCDLVNRTIQDYHDAIARGKGLTAQQEFVWNNKEVQASDACRRAEDLLDSDLKEAAWYAVNAWGSVITGGSECCWSESSFCISNADWSVSLTAVLVPFAVLLLLFTASFLTSLCLPRKSEERALLRKDTIVEQVCPGAAPSGTAADGGLFEAELRGAWLTKSCLRVLPGWASLGRQRASSAP
jgi:hypothetical protein